MGVRRNERAACRFYEGRSYIFRRAKFNKI